MMLTIIKTQPPTCAVIMAISLAFGGCNHHGTGDFAVTEGISADGAKVAVANVTELNSHIAPVGHATGHALTASTKPQTNLISPAEQTALVISQPESPTTTTLDLRQPVRTPEPRQAVRVQLPSGLSNRVTREIADACSLAQRGATYSARAKLTSSLHLIAQALDEVSGGQAHARALIAAFRALDEADDFANFRPKQDDMGIHRLVASHQTPVLKSPKLTNVGPITAQKAYHRYAAVQFYQAVSSEPAASWALFFLGKIHEVHTGSEGGRAAQSIPYYYAALNIDKSNARIGNELGVLLAKQGQLGDAQRVLQHCAQLTTRREVQHNLAAVVQRLGKGPQQPPGPPEGIDMAREKSAAQVVPASNYVPIRGVQHETISR